MQTRRTWFRGRSGLERKLRHGGHGIKGFVVLLLSLSIWSDGVSRLHWAFLIGFVGEYWQGNMSLRIVRIRVMIVYATSLFNDHLFIVSSTYASSSRNVTQYVGFCFPNRSYNMRQRNDPFWNRPPKSAALLISSLFSFPPNLPPSAISFSRSNALLLGSSSPSSILPSCLLFP